LTDVFSLLRSTGALLTVLGILAAALWAVRRFNLVLPGSGGASERRLAVVERLSLDPRRSLALLRRDGVEHLILLAPEGHLVIESHIHEAAATRSDLVVPKAVPRPGLTLPAAASAFVTRMGSDFGALVDRARQPLAQQPPQRRAKQRTRRSGHA